MVQADTNSLAQAFAHAERISEGGTSVCASLRRAEAGKTETNADRLGRRTSSNACLWKIKERGAEGFG